MTNGIGLCVRYLVLELRCGGGGVVVVVEVVVEIGLRGLGGSVEEAVLGEGGVEGFFGSGLVAMEGFEGGAVLLGEEEEDVGCRGFAGQGVEVGGWDVLAIAGAGV